MTADTTYVLLLSEHLSPTATARAIADLPAVFVHRWMMALMSLFGNTERIRQRADEEELRSIAANMGVTQTHMRFVAVLVALAACERAPVAVVQEAYRSVWRRTVKDAPKTYINVALMLAPACLAVPCEAAKDMLPDKLLCFINWKDQLSEAACDASGIRVCRNEDEYYRVLAYVPQTSESAPAKEGVAAKDASAKQGVAAKDAAAKECVAAKDASAKQGVAAKDVAAKGAVAAKDAKPRKIRWLDLPVGGDNFEYDYDAVKSDLHRARMRDVEPTERALLRKLWRLYANCEASMILMRQPDRDPLSAHELAFAACRMLEGLEESLAEFYGTYAIEE